MHEGHRQRLRERYVEHGPEVLGDHELLELLLCYGIARQDVNPLAHRLLEHFGSLEGVLNAGIPALCSVKGVGERSAVLLNLVSTIYRRARQRGSGKRPTLNTPELAGAYLQTLLEGRKTEAFFILLLDNQSRLISAECISEGNHCEALVDPRAVVQSALLNGAAYVIPGHNHPGGSCQPSASDVQLTNRLETMLSGLGISMPEHIIVADDKLYAIRAKSTLRAGNLESAMEVSLEAAVDPYALAQSIKSLDAAELDIVLAALDEE